MSGAKDCGGGRLKQIARAHFERAGPRRGAGPELEAGPQGEKTLDLGDRVFFFFFFKPGRQIDVQTLGSGLSLLLVCLKLE